MAVKTNDVYGGGVFAAIGDTWDTMLTPTSLASIVHHSLPPYIHYAFLSRTEAFEHRRLLVADRRVFFPRWAGSRHRAL